MMKKALALCLVLAIAQRCLAEEDIIVNPCNCEFEFKPVCGSDGQSYISECVLQCSSEQSVNAGDEPISVAHDGFCGDK